MKKAKTLRQETYKKTLAELLASSKEAHTIAKKYKVLAYALSKEWPSKVSPDSSFYSFLEDVVYIDRKIRKLTEGDDQENKDIAEQEWIADNYELGANQKLPLPESNYQSSGYGG